MRKNRKVIFKYLLLISVLMLMMLLCACRTRLTNNTEVSSTIPDEDGFLYSDYQMRRDMLGEPVAEKPVFTGWSSDDSNEDYFEGTYDGLENYDTATDDLDEPEDPPSSTPPSSTPPSSSSGRSSGGSSSSSGRSSSNSSSKKKKKEEKPKVEMVELSIDLNDGDGVVNTISVEKGSTFKKNLPTEVQPADGYKFDGWHKDRTKNSPVDPNAKITESCTVYAHWAKKEEPKKDCTVKWEYDSDVQVADADKLPATIKAGEKFPDPLPAAHKKDYRFLGWYDGSAYIAAGQECTGDSRLVAKFDSWEQIYNNAKPADDKYQFFTADNGIAELVRGTLWDAATAPADTYPAYVIINPEGDETAEQAADRKTKEKVVIGGVEKEPYKNSVIIVIPKDAAKDASKLYYKLLIHNSMYSGLDLTNADKDTEAAVTDYYVSTPPAA